MKKKIVAFMLVICMLAIALIGTTLAYFTDTDEKENVFTVGNVDIILSEPQWDEVGKAEAEDVYPGEALAKDPTVKNNGANPCFVRIKIEGLDQFADDIIYRTDYVDNVLGENWVLHTDGYFYYTQVLASGVTTDALFDQIVIPFSVTNNAEAAPIVVTAYAAQAQGARPSFSAVQAMTVEEIAEWMDTCFGG